MKQEDKQLLLKDLCARLPYGVKVKYLYWDEDKGYEYPIAMILDDINSDGYIRFHGDIAEGEGRGMITQYLPYLRPISSMTEEEAKEVCRLENFENRIICVIPNNYTYHFTVGNAVIDWLNEHHFDYRGLIPMGLALEAPENMYKNVAKLENKLF